MSILTGNPRIEKLQEFLVEHEFRRRKRFVHTGGGDKGTDDKHTIQTWLHPESGFMILVYLRDVPEGCGFEIYVPATNSLKIDETFDATLSHLNDL